MTTVDARPKRDSVTEILSMAKRRLCVAPLVVLVTALLAACGPEAPACNDPKVTSMILEMVGKAHDAHLKQYPSKSKDLASFTLETPTVTAYDDKLKLRSCKTTFVMQIQPDRVAQMNEFISNPNPSLFGALAMLSGRRDALYPDIVRNEVLYLQQRNAVPLTQEPIRKSLTYQVQKEEGSNEYVASTNVDVDGSIQYLRVAAFTDQRAKSNAESKAQAAKEQQQKQIEIDRLAATGNWRRAVTIDGFKWEKDPEFCRRQDAFCFVGQADDLMGSVLYMIKAGPNTTDESREKTRSNLTAGARVCLIGLKKTSDADVFAYSVWSTLRDDKGQLEDCRPGAAEAEAAAKVKGVAVQPVPSAPSASTLPAPVAAPAGTGPESVMSLITKYEACGDEAVCLHTGKGNTVWMQAGQMRRMDYALLDRTISSKTPVCLRELVRTEGKNFTAESLDSQC
ncbi:hypothetical protein ACSFBF_08500 [Variovorax sp. ZT5P49]|uniref:hypothetical protein n=1 Tax=Variovorax sp. ZT5P49 TaxID=3443733 RepID=UPI003F47297C